MVPPRSTARQTVFWIDRSGGDLLPPVVAARLSAFEPSRYIRLFVLVPTFPLIVGREQVFGMTRLFCFRHPARWRTRTGRPIVLSSVHFFFVGFSVTFRSLYGFRPHLSRSSLSSSSPLLAFVDVDCVLTPSAKISMLFPVCYAPLHAHLPYGSPMKAPPGPLYLISIPRRLAKRKYCLRYP